MIKLVPEWAYNYQAFWKSIRTRNIWLIQLRYGAVLMLAVIFLMANYLIEIEFSHKQVIALLFITLFIFCYNLFFQWLRKFLKCSPGKFNPLHFSLLQIIADLISLMFLVYFTGSIETPLYMLFIFHMIIGSLILPGRVILLIAFILTLTFTSIVSFEYYNIIPHHHLSGVHQYELKDNFNYIISTLGLFNFTIFTAVLITSWIAKRLHKREQELIETFNKLDEVEQAKQKYIMAVVHEIKSPIVASQSIVDLLKNEYIGPIDIKVKEKLERINTRSNEAIDLINNILRISKLKLIESVSYEKINLIELVELIIEQKKEISNKKNIEILFNKKSYKTINFNSDKVLLELIISNILGNAIKYTPDKGKVLINLENYDNKSIIRISDTGIGIPEDELKMIFNQFYRASNLPSKSVEGSGLGLALVKEIVERLKGEIIVSSPSAIGTTTNPGTLVKIELPNNQSEAINE